MPNTYIITGASSGFGASLAEAVLARGDRAVLGARRTAQLTAIAERYPDHALAVALDVTDPASRLAAVQSALDRFGSIDVLANIAGRGSLGAAEEFGPDQLRDQMEVNFFGSAELTRAVLPVMRAQGRGRILQLTSIGGLLAAPGFAPYCASKFALEGWSEALHQEVKGFGIHVTIVEPGAFRTEFAGDKNMRPSERIEAYRPVIDPMETYLYGSSGQQPGDPVRAAQAMIDVVAAAQPPLRLILGADAYGAWDAKLASMSTELDAWRARGEATAYPDAIIRGIGEH